MFAIYVQVPTETPMVCATVDPRRNVADWYRRRRNGAWNVGWSTYRDMGDHISYGRSVPDIVTDLVEHKTGRKIRFGCR